MLVIVCQLDTKYSHPGRGNPNGELLSLDWAVIVYGAFSRLRAQLTVDSVSLSCVRKQTKQVTGGQASKEHSPIVPVSVLPVALTLASLRDGM